MSSRRVLFAIHDWGLGHASRSLVLLRELIKNGDHVIILMAPSSGMELLRSELGDTCEFYPYADIPKPFSRLPALFYIRMSLSMPAVWLRFKLEHQLTERLVSRKRVDLVISDSRFGVWSRGVPSYCIFHSLRQIIPGRLRWMERMVEWGQRGLLAGFDKVLIPDVEEDGGLSGDLGHYPSLDWGEGRLVYLGPLTNVSKRGYSEDIDYFFSVSGIEPQRGILAKRVLNALPHLSGRIVVTLGYPAAADEYQKLHGADVYGYLNRDRQAEMLNRAKVVITRSGYTTLMELAELGKKALFVPTPAQSEQEYLARFHRESGHVWSTTQKKLDLPVDLKRAQAAAGLPRISTKDSVRRFFEVVGEGC